VKCLIDECLSPKLVKLAEQIAPLFMSLLSGSIVVAHVSHAPEIARMNRVQAAALLEAKSKHAGSKRPRRSRGAGRG
jgi:hypothetical protein